MITHTHTHTFFHTYNYQLHFLAELAEDSLSDMNDRCILGQLGPQDWVSSPHWNEQGHTLLEASREPPKKLCCRRNIYCERDTLFLFFSSEMKKLFYTKARLIMATDVDNVDSEKQLQEARMRSDVNTQLFVPVGFKSYTQCRMTN